MSRALKRAEKVLKGMANFTRLRILEILDEEETMYVSELQERLGKSQETISKHLRVLRNLDLVNDHSEGPNRRYSLADRKVVDHLLELISLLERGE